MAASSSVASPGASNMAPARNARTQMAPLHYLAQTARLHPATQRFQQQHGHTLQHPQRPGALAHHASPTRTLVYSKPFI